MGNWASLGYFSRVVGTMTSEKSGNSENACLSASASATKHSISVHLCLYADDQKSRWIRPHPQTSLILPCFLCKK